MMIPMQFSHWHKDGYQIIENEKGRIARNNDTTFTVDANVGCASKPNYGVAFSHDISDFNAAANKVGTSCYTKWR
jgi:hypothetical protein